MIGFVSWCLFGGIVGWLFGLVLNGNVQRSGVRNIVAGVAGAVVGSFLLRFSFTPNLLSAGSICIALIGAAAFTAAAGWFARSPVQ